MAASSDSPTDQTTDRRTFLKKSGAGLLGVALGRGATGEGTALIDDTLAPVEALPETITRTWLGRSYWANRLQDWRLHAGWMECLRGGPGDLVRSVAVLSRDFTPGNGEAALHVEAQLLEDEGGGGFCGFLLGAGGGRLDWRAAALVHGRSGEGGGLLCTYETDGAVRFRDHSDDDAPNTLAERPSAPLGSTWRPVPGTPVALRLSVTPQPGGLNALTLTVHTPGSDDVRAGARVEDVPDEVLTGGIALVSSPYPDRAGARWAFRDLLADGGLAVYPDREFGPIAGTLHSLNGSVLKLSAQLTPIGDADPQTVRLETRPAGSSEPWQNRGTATLAPGYVAHFRVDDWDASQDWAYRVAYRHESAQPVYYEGTVRRDPTDAGEVRLGLVSCTIAAARNLDGGGPIRRELPQAEPLGRFTEQNLYFPHAPLARHLGALQPDLLFFCGDQLYEGNPTRLEGRLEPVLDYLYKWYLWVWSFRDLTRSTPTVLLVDDHDVYHPNVWGHGGAQAPDEFWGWNRGGYIGTADFINLVQRTQCGHNPDPYDPTPVERGITVYYGAFRYGRIGFAVLEDRKFKTSPVQGQDMDVHEAELLGPRQEAFLAAWAQDGDGLDARVCVTQTCFACVQTSPAGRPLLDFDANGYPKLGRDRAVALLRDAGALVLAGDQHLATLVRHGIDTHTDGVLQFSGPAAGTSWQRWFEPDPALPNGTGRPNTGDFQDAFGNKVRVLAVANPKISFAEYRAHNTGRGQGLGDRRLKSEGYGLIRVRRAERAFEIECWPWDVNPTAPDARQFDGWPARLSFDETDGRRAGG